MTKAAFDKIAEGLSEALAIARGEKKPVRLYAATEHWSAFMSILEAPVQPDPDIVALAREPAPWGK